MAEKIGFINFTAFDLHAANEFDGIRTRLYRDDRPARTYFQLHPAAPPWRQLSLQGIEPIVRKTPPQLEPLMNEYYRYFAERAVQHEFYQRWWKRHHAWQREANLFFDRFDNLRDHLNETYDRETYAQLGRMNLIFRHAAQKSWINTELAVNAREQSKDDSHHLNGKMLGRKMDALSMTQSRMASYHQLDERQVLVRSQNRALDTDMMVLGRELHPPHAEPPKWAKMLAVAEYAQKEKFLVPTPPSSPAAHAEAVKPQTVPKASPIRGNKI
ncbi:MAG: hypothetical protein H7249_09860 [Chitinophagaceae bacterium]|nr:hypothetical protein [Oligoflexus sp.]